MSFDMFACSNGIILYDTMGILFFNKVLFIVFPPRNSSFNNLSNCRCHYICALWASLCRAFQILSL